MDYGLAQFAIFFVLRTRVKNYTSFERFILQYSKPNIYKFLDALLKLW